MNRSAPVTRTPGRDPEFSPLKKRIQADVCIVGAGVAGLTTAYLLREQGRDVVVVDDGRAASGESGRTTAHLTVALDERWERLERLHGEARARLAAESHATAIDRIEAIVEDEGIDCGFARVDGYLFAARPEQVADLGRELASVHRIGLNDVELVGRAPAGVWDTGPALRFPRQARIDPTRYLNGLARVLVESGVRIFRGTHVDEVVPGRPARVVAGGRAEVVAGSIVVATNAPVCDRLRLPARQAAYRTYVVGLRIRRGSFGPHLLWDTDDPYHYVRTGDEPDVLLVGGEDHRTGRAHDLPQRFERLEQWARTRFAVMGEPLFRWSGQVLEPVDGLAYIGLDPEDDTRTLYVATGFSGNGMTYGTIAGMLLTERIEGRRSRWEDVYDPRRRSLRAFGAWAGKNLDTVPAYAVWMTGGDVRSVDAIAPGMGAVMRRGLSKVAVHRDEKGTLHERSAVCPHLGCIVGWNAAEKSWDCPCHGSRFEAMGAAINGPARTGLAGP